MSTDETPSNDSPSRGPRAGPENDDRRPPGGGGVTAAVDNDERTWELDPDEPWKAADFEARLARAKDQARRTARVNPNYGTAGWSPV